MNKLFKSLSFLLLIVFLVSACAPATMNAAKAAPAAMNYEDIVGRPVSDHSVSDFIARNNCDASGSFQLCHSAGLALWTDKDRIVRQVYLYPRASQNFSAYRGELPFGLAADDKRSDVEQKLGQPKVDHAPQAGWDPGLPDEGASPDHLNFWATYKRFGVTIIYDSPSASDSNANIRAILVNE